MLKHVTKSQQQQIFQYVNSSLTPSMCAKIKFVLYYMMFLSCSIFK
jgi:hypothetical protein